MLQAGIMRRLLLRSACDAPPRSLLELGAGDGTFMLTVARRLAASWPKIRLTLLDRQDIVRHRRPPVRVRPTMSAAGAHGNGAVASALTDQ